VLRCVALETSRIAPTFGLSCEMDRKTGVVTRRRARNALPSHVHRSHSRCEVSAVCGMLCAYQDARAVFAINFTARSVALWFFFLAGRAANGLSESRLTLDLPSFLTRPGTPRSSRSRNGGSVTEAHRKVPLLPSAPVFLRSTSRTKGEGVRGPRRAGGSQQSPS
jgi:hypothetical protein